MFALAAVLLALALMPERLRVAPREAMFDMALSLRPRAAPAQAPPIVVVDIDRDSLLAIGAWPWRRGLIARMVEIAVSRGAAAVAIDILLTGPDQRSPGSVARRLADETGEAALHEVAARLEDGDRRLIAAMADRPVALAILLDPDGTIQPEGPPVLTRGQPRLADLWSATGAAGPLPELADGAAGLGVASLAADADGVVRRVPLLARAAGRLIPGLAVEAARLAAEATGYLLSGPDAVLAVGESSITLPQDGMLRLSPRTGGRAIVTISAARMLAEGADLPDLKGAILFIGSSAPEAGGLRLSHLDPLISSTRLQALALSQLLAGESPRRPRHATALEIALGGIAGLTALVMSLRFRPLVAASSVLALMLVCCALAVALAGRDLLLDPTGALAAAPAGFLATSLAAYSLTRRREAALRRRFEQHLAPGIVARIAAAPESLKLDGERRRVTALFTDIERFSELTARTSPEELIALLDGYFEGVARIIVAHGGMIDKFVGDAVHAIFNVPLDLPDHTDKAIACAVAILRWTEDHRSDALPHRLELGRTRIGIEEGEVVVGDVGLATKLDYTAHGAAMNLAARLEAINKELGTAICIGPSAAAATNLPLRRLGPVEVRGTGTLELFTPDEA